MKRTLLFCLLALASTSLIGQTQIGNSGFEMWEPIPSGGEEPSNWNSFMTASGSFSGNASVQIEQSSDVRPGSSGSTSCRIWSNEINIIITTIVANGNVTLGQINMGNATASNIDNHNVTHIADSDFSEAITDSPDSIVFWVKFTPNGHNENARMKATLHDSYDYQDPEDANSASHVVATAELNYANTNGWVRKSVPFDYSGPASTVEYILVTFTTNETPGGGVGDDEVIIDDVELIYNPNSINELINNMNVYFNNVTDELKFISSQPFDGDYTVYNLSGQKIQSGRMTNSVVLNEPSGIYIVDVNIDGKSRQFKIFK